MQRINSVAKALGDEAAAEIRQLLVDNLELLVVYLGGSPSLRASVETPAGGFVVELGATLSTTTGVVARAGAVKVALVRLLTTLMETNVLRVTHACVVCRVNATIVVGVGRRCHVATPGNASVEQRGAWRRTGTTCSESCGWRTRC